MMINKYEIKSKEIQELMNKPPIWVISWGNILVVFILLIGLSFLFFIDVQEKIFCTFTLVKKDSMNLNNSSPNNYWVIINLSQANRTLIKKNMEVLIELDIYPQEKYGLFEGKIIEISDTLNSDGTYAVKALINENELFKNKTIILLNKMSGNGEIIYKQNTLMRHLLN